MSKNVTCPSINIDQKDKISTNITMFQYIKAEMSKNITWAENLRWLMKLHRHWHFLYAAR